MTPREQARINHPVAGVLNLATLSLCTTARSTRAVEMRSVQFNGAVRAGIMLSGRISDNGFGLILPRLAPHDLRQVLCRQVKGEWARKNLRPTELPWSTVAIDGKHLATLNKPQLRALIARETPLDADVLDVAGLPRASKSLFPQVQVQDKTTGSVGLIRVHRATLISSAAAVLMDQQPILGDTNEHTCSVKRNLSKNIVISGYKFHKTSSERARLKFGSMASWSIKSNSLRGVSRRCAVRFKSTDRAKVRKTS